MIRCPECYHPLDRHKTEFGFYRCRARAYLGPFGRRGSCECRWAPQTAHARTGDPDDLKTLSPGALVRSVNRDVWIMSGAGLWSCVADDLQGEYRVPGSGPWEILVFGEKL